MIKYYEYTTLSEVDDFVSSIIECCEKNNQKIANTDFIREGLIITFKPKLQLVKK